MQAQSTYLNPRRRAKLAKHTMPAIRLLGLTYCPAVVDQKIRGYKPVLFGNDTHELTLYFYRVRVFFVIYKGNSVRPCREPLERDFFLPSDFFKIYEPQPLAQSQHVGVYR